MRRRFVPLLSVAAGAVGALLLARLLLRMLAARPDNPVVAALLSVTAPLVAPFAVLDASQPRFGAVLEFSTLAALGGALALLLVLRVVEQHQNNRSLR